jgi:GNAT superfamily N-acetyltransferase
MIRQAVSADAASIQRLIHQLGYEIGLAEMTNNITIHQQDGAIVFVAVVADNIAGFISGAFIPLFHANEKMLRITALCVDELQRGKGIGKKLVYAIESWCKGKTCFYIEVTSGAHRENDAHPFYLHLGYKVYEGKRFQKRLSATTL